MRSLLARRSVLAALTAAAAALLAWRPGGSRFASLPERTAPGNRYRKLEVGDRPVYLREDLFESNLLGPLTRHEDRP